MTIYTDLFNNLKIDLQKRMDAPFTYQTISKYHGYAKENFKSVQDALKHAKDYFNKYFDGGIKACIPYQEDWSIYTQDNTREYKSHVDYQITGRKYNHDITIKIIIVNDTEHLKKQLDELAKSYNDFINFNDNKLNNDYNLTGFIPYDTWHTASYSFASSGVKFINRETLEIKEVRYDWQDYEYNDASMRDEHDYYIEKLAHNINPFAKKFYNYSELLKAKKNNTISKGAIIEVVKGRKLPKGFTGVVKDFSDIHDCYNRYIGEYVHLEDGNRINKNNVIIKGFIENAELVKYL